MRTEIDQVVGLQSMWTSANSVEMQLRGSVIRNDLPRSLEPLINQVTSRLPEGLSDFKVEGRDGTGLKSEVPWVRIYSQSRSRSATEGWYLVYLFDAFGNCAYLSINQGTTQWRNGEFRPRPFEQLVQRAGWARTLLAEELAARPDLLPAIELPTRASSLGRGYEFGNVAAIRYEANAVPSEARLQADFAFMLNLLAVLYEDLDLALEIPGEPAPEVLDALELADVAAGRPASRVHYRLNAAERFAIERRAVDSTARYLTAQGYRSTDVGANNPYDLRARRGDEVLFVEVKGTVSAGADVILTKNEVALHLKEFPRNMLSIVSEIKLSRGKPPKASGGTLRVWSPWALNESSLTPLSYSYSVPPSGLVVPGDW